MIPSGSYTVSDKGTFQDYLKAIGYSGDVVIFTLDVIHDGDRFTINEKHGDRVKSTTFTVGEEFDEIIMGKPVPSMASIDNDTLTIKNGDTTKTFTVTPTGLEILYKTQNASGTLIFKKD
ncbi:fatty acid-binding protein, liver [Diabrotica virgifera virgifera]|uniref:Fatty acid-binding protein, liver-like n=1 Tax=Diabrotica virgifera virgifera TaxID=50390 RepID=A0A6P7F2Q4_DIAVI|nr:fatty acid-binding protein, liver [Diabrotica virgifera virgifera]